MDNYYNSPELARALKQHHSTDCVGTLKLNRKNVPKEVKEKKLKKGEIIARHSGPVTVLKWCDKKNVTFVSTYHNEETRRVTKRGKETVKPLCAIDYNYGMGGVDLKDQLLHMFLVERKRTTKWYIKLFKRLLNATVLNSLIIFRQATGTSIEQLSYRIQLVEGLFTKYARTGGERNIQGRRASDNTVPRLQERHFIRKLAPKSEKSKPQRRCVVCSKHGKKKTSVYCCQECDVGLCLEECFELYHTKLNY
ncbi:piggyBac transposable element-derived protein 4-like [Anabrus simplex]|uniref:piggyBac transposable element-derived protein 4-like n=1 Tax=Anabrus simplex TaxID=316456 RepID=UPI0034DD8A33